MESWFTQTAESEKRGSKFTPLDVESLVKAQQMLCISVQQEFTDPASFVYHEAGIPSFRSFRPRRYLTELVNGRRTTEGTVEKILWLDFYVRPQKRKLRKEMDTNELDSYFGGTTIKDVQEGKEDIKIKGELPMEGEKIHFILTNVASKDDKTQRDFYGEVLEVIQGQFRHGTRTSLEYKVDQLNSNFGMIKVRVYHEYEFMKRSLVLPPVKPRYKAATLDPAF